MVAYKLLYTFMIFNDANIAVRYEVFGDWGGQPVMALPFQFMSVKINNETCTMWREIAYVDISGVQPTEGALLAACEKHRATIN